MLQIKFEDFDVPKIKISATAEWPFHKGSQQIVSVEFPTVVRSVIASDIYRIKCDDKLEFSLTKVRDDISIPGK